MDIAKIRKKIKKAEETTKYENNKTEQKESVEQRTPEVTAVPQGVDVETETKQEDVKKPELISKAESTESAGAVTEEKPDAIEETEILAFKIANEEYAVRMTDLQEIIRYQRITAVPCSPKYLVGITSLRGKILPVIDLKIRLGRKKEPLGVLVDLILGVFRLPVSEFLPPPSILTEEEKNFIESVAKIKNKFISVLNVDEITKIEIL
ncbi:MAG: chemotaxis protein CheW [Nitrospirae bacterium]|nr:chemotaxis protein CheW [Nitrospirota bacterium]